MKMYNEYFLKYSRNSWVGSWAKGKQFAALKHWGDPWMKSCLGKAEHGLFPSRKQMPDRQADSIQKEQNRIQLVSSLPSVGVGTAC